MALFFKKGLAAAATVSLLVTGCTFSFGTEDGGDSPAVSFSTVMTRAAVDTDRNGMQDFAVWGGFDSTNNLFDNTHVSPHGHYEGTRYWIPGKIHDFHALHPAGLQGVSCTDDGIRTVKGFDTSLKRGSEAIDLMTASATGIEYLRGQAAQAVPLRFSHALSRVKISISTKEAVTVSDIMIAGIAYKGDFTTRPDADTPWSSLTVSTLKDTPFRQDDFPLVPENGETDLLGGEMLLIPQALSDEGNNPSVFTMKWRYADGQSRTVSVPLPKAGAHAWESGKSYRYTAVIPTHSGTIDLKVSVGDWTYKRVDADL